MNYVEDLKQITTIKELFEYREKIIRLIELHAPDKHLGEASSKESEGIRINANFYLGYVEFIIKSLANKGLFLTDIDDSEKKFTVAYDEAFVIPEKNKDETKADFGYMPTKSQRDKLIDAALDKAAKVYASDTEAPIMTRAELHDIIEQQVEERIRQANAGPCPFHYKPIEDTEKARVGLHTILHRAIDTLRSIEITPNSIKELCTRVVMDIETKILKIQPGEAKEPTTELSKGVSDFKEFLKDKIRMYEQGKGLLIARENTHLSLDVKEARELLNLIEKGEGYDNMLGLSNNVQFELKAKMSKLEEVVRNREKPLPKGIREFKELLERELAFIKSTIEGHTARTNPTQAWYKFNFDELQDMINILKYC